MSAIDVEDSRAPREPVLDHELDPVHNIALPATRLQQAERVRNTLRLMSSALSKAKLRRAFRRHQNDTIRELAKTYPMYKLYQVRPLALSNVTYAGSVGFIMSYTEYGGVSMAVFYDRPGHPSSDPRNRALIDPTWLEELTLDQFEEIVKKDNPTIVLT